MSDDNLRNYLQFYRKHASGFWMVLLFMSGMFWNDLHQKYGGRFDDATTAWLSGAYIVSFIAGAVGGYIVPKTTLSGWALAWSGCLVLPLVLWIGGRYFASMCFGAEIDLSAWNYGKGIWAVFVTYVFGSIVGARVGVSSMPQDSDLPEAYSSEWFEHMRDELKCFAVVSLPLVIMVYWYWSSRP